MSIKSYIKSALNLLPHKQIHAEIGSLSPSTLLSGKTALITGGTSGIGKAIAIAFVKAGANVIITSRREDKARTGAERIKEECQAPGRIIVGIELDTTKVDSFDSKIHEILENPGLEKIDILVNNAGVNKGESYDCSEEDYDKILDTNLKGYFFLSRCIGNYMIESKIQGNILNIASASSLRPAASPYVLSKWGVKGLTAGLAKKFIKYGIVVNGLAPGPTATPMLYKADTNDIYLPVNPSQRFAMPEEIANMAVILTSNLCRLVVGDILYMTGGAGIITYDDLNY